MVDFNSARPAKYARGKNPNSLRNLRPPYKPGENGHNFAGYNLKERLMHALMKPLRLPDLDAPSAEHLVYSTIQGALLRESSPFKEVWERCEGKVKEQVETTGEITIRVKYDDSDSDKGTNSPSPPPA